MRVNSLNVLSAPKENSFSHEQVNRIVDQLLQKNFEQFKIEKNRLIPRTRVERVWSHLPWNRAESHQSVRSLLNKLHAFYEKKIGYNGCLPRSSKDFFFRILPKTDSTLFDRSKISVKMQHCLSPELHKLKNAKSVGVDYAIAQAKLADALGVKPRISKKGWTKALIYTDLTGREIGIFKVARKKIDFISRLQDLLGYRIWGFNKPAYYCRSQGALPDFFSEIAAASVDDFLKYALIPPTTLTTLQDQLGSFMLWVHGGRSPDSYKIQKNCFYASEIETYQKFVVEDFLIGNIDRHNDNWFYHEENGHISSIFAIDNANSFLEKNPSTQTLKGKWTSFWARRHQYQWKEFRLADIPLLPKIKTAIKKLTPLTVDRIFRHIGNRFPKTLDSDAFFSSEMRAKFYQRARVLQKAGRKTNMTPRQLAYLFSDKAMQEFLNP